MESSEIGKYFQEHSEQITETMIIKSFRDGVETEGKTTAYIRKMQEKGQNVRQIAEKFKITPYMYYSDFSELDKAQTELTEECKRSLDEGIVSDAVKKGKKVNGISSEFYQDSESSKSDCRRMYELFEHKQDEAVLHAINQYSLVTIHVRDANSLTKELEQIKGRTAIEKIKDIFTGQSRMKRERATEIERALTIITKRIESDKDRRDNPSMPQEQITPEPVVVNLYRARSIIETTLGSNSEGAKRYSEMIEYVRGHYQVDYKKVNEMINADKSQLPQVAGNGAKPTERQKMDYFLKHQGYTEEAELSAEGKDKKNSAMQPLDPFKTWTIGKIESIRGRIPRIKEIETILGAKEGDKAVEPKTKEEIKGMGEGFNIVR